MSSLAQMLAYHEIISSCTKMEDGCITSPCVLMDLYHIK